MGSKSSLWMFSTNAISNDSWSFATRTKAWPIEQNTNLLCFRTTPQVAQGTKLKVKLTLVLMRHTHKNDYNNMSVWKVRFWRQFEFTICIWSGGNPKFSFSANPCRHGAKSKKAFMEEQTTKLMLLIWHEKYCFQNLITRSTRRTHLARPIHWSGIAHKTKLLTTLLWFWPRF